jgi:multidrug efflux pump subunit AcrB
MARNPVAANLLMLLFLLGGVVVGLSVKQEVFPDFKLDIVSVSVPYPGASPEEVESGVIVAVEESVRGITGVDRVTSNAAEGSARVLVELSIDADPNKLVSDIKNSVDRITSLPEEAERPIVNLVTNRVEVIGVILYGPENELALRELAESTRDRLLGDPNVSQAELISVPGHEITIEISQAQLRAHGLTLEQVAQKVAATALELPGGSVRTRAGEVLVRTAERRSGSTEFRDIPIISGSSGAEVHLGDIATIEDDFAETDETATFNGQPAIMLKVYRVGDQTPIQVADAVKAQVEQLRTELPAGVQISTWMDWSDEYRQRMNLLLRNAYLGLILVLLVLGLFLELRLAVWVTMGIPVSFLGGLLLMPSMDVSVNMISLFAFIVTLGMVVDDAIVVGENIHNLRQKGVDFVTAAIRGAREVAIPVTFSIATTIAAFMPMFFVPGFSGKLYRVIPAIVVTVLCISLVESLFILPAHLGHLKETPKTGWYATVHRYQQKVSGSLSWAIVNVYAPVLRWVLKQRYVSIAIGLSTLIISVGWIAGGRTAFRYMPSMDGDLIIASIELPYGTSVRQTEAARDVVVEAGMEILAENGGTEISRGVFAQIGALRPADPGQVGAGASGGHVANVQILLVPADQREITSGEMMDELRERVGHLPGVESLRFSADIGPNLGKPVDVELSHDDHAQLEQAAGEMAQALRDYEGVFDVDDGFDRGKPQLDLSLRPEAASLGLTSGDIARQVRGAFYGAEALRQMEGRNEIRVIARLPADERRSEQDVGSLVIRTPSGGEILLREAADIDRGRSSPPIKRADGRRVTNVSGDIREGTIAPSIVLEALTGEIIPDLQQKYPGLYYEFGGQNREQEKVMASLMSGAKIAALVVFALLAIPFKSYLQPIIVMAAIPFGMVGALIGHVIMGYELSIISVMGLVALGGVVVNDSLVLIDAANRYRRAGKSALDGILSAGVRRFRPILLTSLTTFLGLMPMIMETSVQARFLIPMAISLAFGVLFATVIILLLVPAFYMVLEDFVSSARIVLGLDPVESAAQSQEMASSLTASDSFADMAASSFTGPADFEPGPDAND